jgi:hypothetical protein
MRMRYLMITALFMLFMVSCTKPYAPKVTTTATNYLVVEGIINTGSNDSTAIKLSRTVPIQSAAGVVPEHGATVEIQDNQNQTYSLTETTTGLYVTGELNLDNTRQYRLNITTADGKNYVSDYLSPEVNPPIDSIGYTLENNGLQIYANTHNPQNTTHYYRWDYTETWHFHADYESDWVTNGTAMVPRTPSQDIYYCWTNDISNDIILGSSAKLAQDVIYQQPITFIEATSEKLETRYSILLKQYALNTAGYTYFSELRENTEELGGIFDPQPVTGLTGNLHCTTDPSLPVIGYITAGVVQQKRIFIDNMQLPKNFTPIYPFMCEQDTAFYSDPRPPYENEVLPDLILSPANIESQALYKQGATLPYAFLFTDRDCADCTIRGTTIQPAFWISNQYGL